MHAARAVRRDRVAVGMLCGRFDDDDALLIVVGHVRLLPVPGLALLTDAARELQRFVVEVLVRARVLHAQDQSLEREVPELASDCFFELGIDRFAHAAKASGKYQRSLRLTASCGSTWRILSRTKLLVTG